jgi:hypothetical protein
MSFFCGPGWTTPASGAQEITKSGANANAPAPNSTGSYTFYAACWDYRLPGVRQFTSMSIDELSDWVFYHFFQTAKGNPQSRRNRACAFFRRQRGYASDREDVERSARLASVERSRNARSGASRANERRSFHRLSATVRETRGITHVRLCRLLRSAGTGGRMNGAWISAL